ncbi:alanine racemase [Nocardia arthritidis]|uniref:Type III PLP-dependent enzyme n=1 Tax=Nocardia arthritidis TaxID=228602 RepID=A0A6G9YLM0_9NOCA|nr:alanine racemase [Nocardia arthritidis]QIS14081.1 type III PLP-dependent enzyme [Nocardia arthritidis]
MTIELPRSAAPLRALPATTLAAAVVERLCAADRPVNAYLYDTERAAERARRLRACLPDWAEIFYAVKANSFEPMLTALAAEVDGFEVASVREIELAGKAATAAGRTARLVAAGPAKTAPVLSALVAAGAEAVNVESVAELYRLDEAAVQAGVRMPVALRVNPDRVPVTGSLTMGGAATVFGTPESDVPEVLSVAATLPSVQVVGFHIHAVCNNLDAAAHAAYVRWCLDYSTRTAAVHGIELRLVDTGGGIGVAFGDEQPFDLDRFGDELSGIRPPDGVRVLFEPGRWPVTECGYYAAEVVDIKHAYGTWFAVLRGGINHFQLPTSWDIVHNFTVVPIEPWTHRWPRRELIDTPVTVVGELCTPEDTLARDITVDRIRIGDIVVFPNAGSYGWEFAMPEFLGHPPAPRWVL